MEVKECGLALKMVGIFVLDLKTFFKDTSSTAKHFNTSNGLSNDQISDIIEYKK